MKEFRDLLALLAFMAATLMLWFYVCGLTIGRTLP